MLHFILELSRLQLSLIAAVVLAALFFARKWFCRFYARLKKPSRDRKARWLALATVVDINRSAEVVKASTKSLTESLVDKLLTKLTDELPEVVSESLISRVVAGIPDAIEKKFHDLTMQIRALRAERDALTWIPIPVYMHGFKVDENDKTTHYYAFIMMNRSTGQTRAASSHDDRRIVSYSDKDRDYSPSKRLKVGLTPGHPVGAPWYSRVHDQPKLVVMLGETYWVG